MPSPIKIFLAIIKEQSREKVGYTARRHEDLEKSFTDEQKLKLHYID